MANAKDWTVLTATFTNKDGSIGVFKTDEPDQAVATKSLAILTDRLTASGAITAFSAEKSATLNQVTTTTDVTADVEQQRTK